MVKALWAAALLAAGSGLRAEEVPPPAADVSASSAAFVWRQEPNTAFQAGESILYVIKYGILPAGHATLEVRGVETVHGRRAYHVLSQARSNKVTDLIFKVRDSNESWMDVESLCSLRFRQKMREGFYRREVRSDYDHPAGRFRYLKKRKDVETVEEGPIPAFVHDVLSNLYYVRTRPLEVGKEYAFDANSGARTWPLKVKVKRIKRVTVPAGKFDCLHIEPIMAGEGLFKNEDRIDIYMTNDERRIPVLLRSRVMVGAFEAEMREYRAGDGVGAPEPTQLPEGAPEDTEEE